MPKQGYRKEESRKESILLKIPLSLREKIVQHAKEQHISINEYINRALERPLKSKKNHWGVKNSQGGVNA